MQGGDHLAHFGTKGVPMREEDTIFNNLRKAVKKPTQASWEKATWISEAPWRLADQRMALRMIHVTGQRELQASTRFF